MRIVITADTPEEKALKTSDDKPLLPIEFAMVRRFALTGQTITGDFQRSHGFWPDLLGDLKRLKCRVEWELMKEKTHVGTPNDG